MKMTASKRSQKNYQENTGFDEEKAINTKKMEGEI